MDLNRKTEGGSEFEPAPEGVHNAVCVSIVDLGTQKERAYQSTEIVEKRLVEIRWELDETRDDGKPFMIMKRYKQSLHEKSALRAHLEAWQGKPFSDEQLDNFDLNRLLGRGCQIQIGRTEGGNAKIMSVMALSKGAKAPKPSIVPFLLDLDAFDKEAFDALSDRMKETIAKSPEYQALQAKKTANGAKPAAKPAVAAKPAKPSAQVEHAEDLDDEIAV